MATKPVPATGTRTMLLSQHPIRARHAVDPQAVIDQSSCIAEFTTLAIRLSEQVRKDADVKGRVQSCLVAEEEPGSARVLLKPSTKLHPDHVTVDWTDGRSIRLHLGPVMHLKNLQVPRGHRLVVPVGQVNDPEYGPCIVLDLGASTLMPKRRTRRHLEQVAAATQSAPEQA